MPGTSLVHSRGLINVCSFLSQTKIPTPPLPLPKLAWPQHSHDGMMDNQGVVQIAIDNDTFNFASLQSF